MRTTALGLIGLTWLLASGLAAAQECDTDEDCPQWQVCDPPPTASAGCAPEPCDAGAPPEPQPGSCEPGEIACDSDADCPEGLTCGEQRSISVACTSPDPDSGPDAGIVCTDEDVEVERSCVFDTSECETDADCTQDGFACLQTQATGVQCSQSQSACPEGEKCPPPEEPVCEETSSESVTYCFPDRVDCTSNGDCADDWRCVELPEDAMDKAPMAWQGATDICLPEGLALALDGTIRVGSTTQVKSKSADGAGLSGGSKQSGAESGNAGESGDDSSSGGSSSGCAIGAREAGTTLPLALLATLALLRRRRHG